MAGSNIPTTQYADSGGLNIAYQVFGDGRLDLVFVPGIISNLDLAWEYKGYVRVWRGLARAFRVIAFDKRGQGLSDPFDGAPSLEERVDDLRAVMDAAKSRRAIIFGLSEGGPMSLLFAASYPARVERLVLCGAMARYAWAEDYPHRPRIEERLDGMAAAWGTEETARIFAPSRADDAEFMAWATRFMRQTATPNAIRRFILANERIDVRAILPEIRTPTLVIHRRGDQVVSRENGRYLADHIPDAIYHELPGVDHMPWVGDSQAIIDAVVHFAAAEPVGSDADRADGRMLATALFTDIENSTAQLAAMGDSKWREVLDRHDDIAGNLVDRFQGRVVKTTGDGLLATFDGPARAVRCAIAFRGELKSLGLVVRAGLHAGEVEQRQNDVTGLAIHIAARVMDHAAGGEILVSRTVMDLTAGTDLVFEPAGSHQFKGVPGTFELYKPVR